VELVTVEQLIEELQKHRKTRQVCLAVDTLEHRRVVSKVKEVRLIHEPAISAISALKVELS
jgi:hypothetical protein